jgi:peptide-methionine (S)-S-oxide reductase
MAESDTLATFGGGCFWCTEAVFEQVRGVDKVVPGYAGGHIEHPSYEQVCGKQTGHAEVVQIHFDPTMISYRDLLHIFFATHDPTTPNRQGNDVGPQYRSVIYTHSAEQQQIAVDVIAELNQQRIFPAPIVTEVQPFTNFYPAEAYHHAYYRNNPGNPYCSFVIEPKLAKFRKLFARLLKE